MRRYFLFGAAWEGSASTALKSIVFIILYAAYAFAQRERGSLTLEVRDPSGAALAAYISLSSEGNQVQRAGETNAQGLYEAQNLPFANYHLVVTHPGFSPVDRLLAIKSEVPITLKISLILAPVATQ